MHDILLFIDTLYVTGPAKIGHICTQNLALFLNFNLQYLLKYKCYCNEIFMPYLQTIRKQRKFTEHEYHKHRPKSTIFRTCVFCTDMPGFHRPSHVLCLPL